MKQLREVHKTVHVLCTTFNVVGGVVFRAELEAICWCLGQYVTRCFVVLDAWIPRIFAGSGICGDALAVDAPEPVPLAGSGDVVRRTDEWMQRVGGGHGVALRTIVAAACSVYARGGRPVTDTLPQEPGTTLADVVTDLCRVEGVTTADELHVVGVTGASDCTEFARRDVSTLLCNHCSPGALYLRFVDFMWRVFDISSDNVDRALCDATHACRRDGAVNDWVCAIAGVCGTDAARLRKQAATASGTEATDGDDDEQRSLRDVLCALALMKRMDVVAAAMRADVPDDGNDDDSGVASVVVDALLRGRGDAMSRRSRLYFSLPRVRADSCRSVGGAWVTRTLRRAFGETVVKQQAEMVKAYVAGESNAERSGGMLHPLAILTREGLGVLLGPGAVAARVDGGGAAAASAAAATGVAAGAGAARRGGSSGGGGAGAAAGVVGAAGGSGGSGSGSGRIASRERYANRATIDPTDSEAISKLAVGTSEFHRVCGEFKTDGVVLMFTVVTRVVVMVEHVWDDESGRWVPPAQNIISGAGAVIAVRRLPRDHANATFGGRPVALEGATCGPDGLPGIDNRIAGMFHPNAVPRQAHIGTPEQLREGGSRHITSIDPGGGYVTATTDTGVQTRNTISGGSRSKRGGVYDAMTGAPLGRQREDAADTHASRRRTRAGWTPAPVAAAIHIRAQFAGESPCSAAWALLAVITVLTLSLWSRRRCASISRMWRHDRDSAACARCDGHSLRVGCLLRLPNGQESQVPPQRATSRCNRAYHTHPRSSTQRSGRRRVWVPVSLSYRSAAFRCAPAAVTVLSDGVSVVCLQPAIPLL